MSSSVSRSKWQLPSPKAPLGVVMDFVTRSEVWIRIGLFLLFTSFLYLATTAWNPAFPYRTRIAPQRNLHARTEFEAIDKDATSHARTQAREKFANYYINNSRPLDQIQQGLIDDIFEVMQKSHAESGNFWLRFLSVDPQTNLPNEAENNQKEFEKFRDAFANDSKLTATAKAIENAFVDLRRSGLLLNLEHELGQGSMQEIQVYESNLDDAILTDVSQVRLAETLDQLNSNLIEEFSKYSDRLDEPSLVAERVFNWLRPRLPTTLSWDEENSRRGQRAAAAAVSNKLKLYRPGDPLEKLSYQGLEEPVIRAFEPLDESDIQLLQSEHRAFLENRTIRQCLIRSISFFGLFLPSERSFVAIWLFKIALC